MKLSIRQYLVDITVDAVIPDDYQIGADGVWHQ